MILVKSGVKFQRFTPALVRMLDVLDSITLSGRALVPGMPEDLVITSANDGAHMVGSRHYRDAALDIRSKTFPNLATKDLFCMVLRTRLGPKFTVLLENAGTDNEHAHIQVKKGGVYP